MARLLRCLMDGLLAGMKVRVGYKRVTIVGGFF